MKKSLLVTTTAVAAISVAACVPPQVDGTQTWSCIPGETVYTWTEYNNTNTVVDGDARMYYFAASHDSTVVLVSSRVCP